MCDDVSLTLAWPFEHTLEGHDSSLYSTAYGGPCVRVISLCSAVQCNAEERNSSPDLANSRLADFRLQQYHADDWPPRCAPLIHEVVRFVAIIAYALSSR